MWGELVEKNIIVPEMDSSNEIPFRLPFCSRLLAHHDSKKHEI